MKHVRVVRGVVGGMLVLVAAAGSLGAQRSAPRPAAAPPASPATASAAGARIGFVNAQVVLQQAPGYQQAESTFSKEVETYRAEVQKLQGALDSAATEFENQSVVLSPTQRQAKRKELETQQQTVQKRTEELRQKADTRRRELLQPIEQKVSDAIEAVRAEGSYAIIFDVGTPGNILTADRSLDLTQRVIARVKGGS